MGFKWLNSMVYGRYIELVTMVYKPTYRLNRRPRRLVNFCLLHTWMLCVQGMIRSWYGGVEWGGVGWGQ